MIEAGGSSGAFQEVIVAANFVDQDPITMIS
jgi:hypothetical protein